MRRTRLSATLSALSALLATACTPTTNQTVPFVATDAAGTDAGSKDAGADIAEPLAPDVGLSSTGTLPAGAAGLTVKVRMAKDFPNQLDGDLRKYASGTALSSGDLWLELCADADCQTVQFATKALPGAVLTSAAKALTVSQLPAGTFFARFVLDSQYSAKEYGGGVAVTGQFGPFDVLQSNGADPKPSEGKNPLPGSTQVTLAEGATADVAEAVLGTLVLPDPTFTPTPEHAQLIAAASGPGAYRNAMKLIDLDTFQVQPAVVPELGGKPFDGDLCGFVRGSGDALYVIGVGGPAATKKYGAYVFTWDLAKQAFSSAQPAYIAHPDCKKGACSGTPDAASFPFPCRGVAVPADPAKTPGARDTLYLTEWKGAGSLTFTQAYQLTVVKMDAVGGGALAFSHGPTEGDFLTSKRIFRGIAVADGQLLLAEPSWSSQVADEAKKAGTTAETTIWRVPFTATGDVDFGKRTSFKAGKADDSCGTVAKAPPAFGVFPYGDKSTIFVGFDEGIRVFAADGTPIGSVDTKTYGKLPTSFALAPDGKTLYAMPNCKAEKPKAHVLKGIGKERADLDRHAIAVLSLDAAATVPPLAELARDFDEDGLPDGGVDAAFLYLKRDLLRWCTSCVGVLPPTSYTGPELVAGGKSLFLRGTGVQSTGKNSAGLGQLSDLGVFDRATGKGVMFRGYRLWLDGPSARWGFDLHPENATRTYDDDQSVGALIVVPKP